MKRMENKMKNKTKIEIAKTFSLSRFVETICDYDYLHDERSIDIFEFNDENELNEMKKQYDQCVLFENNFKNKTLTKNNFKFMNEMLNDECVNDEFEYNDVDEKMINEFKNKLNEMKS